MATTEFSQRQAETAGSLRDAVPAKATGAGPDTPDTAQADRSTVAAATYPKDLFERWVLFLDTLRERADNMIEHERRGMPPLLDFKYETLLDARRFDRPSNYALLRITEIDLPPAKSLTMM